MMVSTFIANNNGCHVLFAVVVVPSFCVFCCCFFLYFSLKTKSAFKSLVAFFHLLITDVFVHYFFRFFIKFILVFALALILRVIR